MAPVPESRLVRHWHSTCKSLPLVQLMTSGSAIASVTAAGWCRSGFNVLLQQPLRKLHQLALKSLISPHFLFMQLCGNLCVHHCCCCFCCCCFDCWLCCLCWRNLCLSCVPCFDRHQKLLEPINPRQSHFKMCTCQNTKKMQFFSPHLRGEIDSTRTEKIENQWTSTDASFGKTSTKETCR